MKNVLLSASLVAAALFALPAQAVTVSFNYTNTNVAGGDQSGKTSPLLDKTNTTVLGSGLFIETFGKAGADGKGCALVTPADQVDITGGSYALQAGTTPGVAAAPAGDSTCFAYGPAANSGSTSALVNIDYTKLLSTLGANASLNYLGLYYGSIDFFNDLIFYNAAGQVIKTVTGTELIGQSGAAGNQNSDMSNIYVNLFFSPSEQFTSFSFRTTGIAFEMDNLVIGYNIAPPTGVPEPTSIALLGLGLAALGASRRRKNAA